jgi:paraquat-inducible protein A
MTDVMVLALMIFYVNSSGYTEATVLPGVYFFAASAIITMLAYGWANSVPVARPLHREVAITPLAVQPAEPLRDADGTSHVVSMPTNPGRRHRPA